MKQIKDGYRKGQSNQNKTKGGWDEIEEKVESEMLMLLVTVNGLWKEVRIVHKKSDNTRLGQKVVILHERSGK